MRTRSWLLALSSTVVPAVVLAAGCGDSGGASGGAGGAATGTVSGVTVGTTGKSVTSGVTSSKATTGVTDNASVTTAASTTASGTTTGTTSASTTSSSTGGGSSGFAFDTCAALAAAPPNPVILMPGMSMSLTDSNAGAGNELSTFCPPSATGSDLVYQVNTTDDCTFTAGLNPGFNGVLSLRDSCDSRPGGTQCGSTQTPFLGDLPAGPHYVVVKGVAAADAGPFTLTLNCATPTCGDGVRNPGEQCDEGPNPSPASGCGVPNTPTQCQIISTPASDTCAAPTELAVAVNNVTPTNFPANGAPPYNTTGSHDDYTPIADPAQCPFVGGGAAYDQVFHVHATVAGHLNVTIGYEANFMTDACAVDPSSPFCWNTGVFIREGSCTGGTQTACGIEGNNNPGEYTVSSPVQANTEYYVFVKANFGLNDAAQIPFDEGPYVLQVQLTDN